MLTGLYAYIYCMMVSQALTDMPVYGGALFMCAQVATVFMQTFTGRIRQYLSPRIRAWRWAILALLMLLNICVLVVYPLTISSPQVWLLFSVVLSIQLRDAMCTRLVQLSAANRLTEKRFMAYMGLWHALALAAMGVILLYNVQTLLALVMLVGYLLCALAGFYDMLKERDALRQLPAASSGDAQQTRAAVTRANAFTVFERLSILVMAAMEMTLIVMYTFLAATAEQMLIRMALAVLTTLVGRELAAWFLSWRRRRNRGDATNLLLVGLILWLYGLWTFSRMLGEGAADLTKTYLCLGLCSVGSALCAACLDGMEKSMGAVARFTSGGDVPGYYQLRAAHREVATLLGQMLALAALTALCFLTGYDLPRTAQELAEHFQPVMVLPALLIVLMALLCTFRFPLSSRYEKKLMQFLHIREAGGENPALEKQLQSVVVQRHIQPFFVRTVIAVLRPFFRHTIKGAENIRQDESNPIVFLCNHGEVYGPVASILYSPVPVRPWSISELCNDPLEVAQYSYKYTFSQIKWLGPLRWPVARLLGPITVSVFAQLECVPVFRNKPRELMTTFRKSVEAMQAGDNLLIFPENPDADPDAPGYEHGRPGDLFSGFPMLAQVYYNRTGKRCRFLPMLAHKGARTISYGTEILYNPDNDPITERDRVVQEASRQMQELYEREEALWQKKKDK